MNLPCFPVVALLGALTSIGDAFTLDAAGYEGGALAKDPFSVLVPGYGDVVFESGIGTPLVVDPAYGNGHGFDGSPLCFEPGDLVRIGFSDSSGAGIGARAAASSFQAHVQGEADESAPKATVWNAVPEPATAGLGLVGIAALLLGRRR